MSQEHETIRTQFLEDIKKNSGLMISMGVILLLMGLLVMGSPMVAGVSLALVIGVMLIIGGIGQLVIAVKTGKGIPNIIVGVLTLFIGGYMVNNPGAAMTIFLAAYLIISGIFEVLMSFQVKPVKGWRWTLFSGIVSVLLGIMIWSQFPLSGAWAIGILIGVRLFFSGLALLMFGFSAQGATKEITGAS